MGCSVCFMDSGTNAAFLSIMSQKQLPFLAEKQGGPLNGAKNNFAPRMFLCSICGGVDKETCAVQRDREQDFVETV